MDQKNSDTATPINFDDSNAYEEDDIEEQQEDEEMTESDTDEDNEDGYFDEKPKVYLPSQETDDAVELECDKSAYIFYHDLKAGAPCLSFDVIQDEFGDDRADNFPLTMTMLVGSQMENAKFNYITAVKVSNINKYNTKSLNKASDSEDSDSSESEEEAVDEGDVIGKGSMKPVLQCAKFRHDGGVNRIRTTEYGTPLAASWSENGKVYLWDIFAPLNAVKCNAGMVSYIQNCEAPKPIFYYSHQIEGYAMDWSPLTPGVLATGDCHKFIHLWKPTEGGSWQVSRKPYTAHANSVEDIQWSPNENNVMASCSVDRSIRIWDIRVAPNKACMLTKRNAHDSDVNVINWNKFDPFLLSGGDDGTLKVWDLRNFPEGTPLCIFKHHTSPITSVEWHPTDRSVFAASGADDQLTLWDLAVERDEKEAQQELRGELKDLPAQLLFIHQGQSDIKEIHWHKQMPGVLISTALSGFNIFRTVSV